MHTYRLPHGFSLYLDLVRLFASVMVVLYHASDKSLSPTRLPLSYYGHEAVVVFFVLSGMVIAYVAQTRETTAIDYASSRFARILSVALPVLLLTPLFDAIGQAANAAIYIDKTTHSMGFIRFVSSVLFLNEAWLASIMYYSNVPYWSLCYEVWYYVLFGVLMFMHGRARMLTAVGICLLLGPKFLLMAPLWFAGVYTLKHMQKNKLSTAPALGLLLLSSLMMVFYFASDMQNQGEALLATLLAKDPHKVLVFAKSFLSDYWLTVAVCLHFTALHSLSKHYESSLAGASKIIRTSALLTFPLYLLHQPLLWLFTAVLPVAPSLLKWSWVLTLTFVCLIFFTILTEWWRPRLKQWSTRLLHRCKEKALKT
ncbi:MAG: hypothetical protein RLZZ502_1713 [Pseudomonadota bacterium]|jgi:peptidoglycan/LPS O-acetylase OafA/YrhL